MMSTQKEISIHYSPRDGVKWAKYLQSNLHERQYEIEIALNDVTSDNRLQRSSRINVFLITPDFLELVDLKIMKGFDCQFSLAILMGVDTENFTLITTQRGVHEDVKEWLTLAVDGSEESVKHLLMTIVTMYEYDFPPTRIRPIFMEVIDEGMKVYIGLKRKAESDVSVQFDGKEKEVKATFTNKYFYSFSLPDNEEHTCSTFSVMCKEHNLGEGQLRDLVPPHHDVNAPDVSRCASRAFNVVHGKQSKIKQLRELLEEVTNPINLLCQCMGMCGSDREELDRKLANKISLLGYRKHLSLMDMDEETPPSVRRWSDDSGFGDKVRPSQIMSYIDKVGSQEGSQFCPPPPALHVGSKVSVVGYIRPLNPPLRESNGEQYDENFRDNLENSGASNQELKGDKETNSELQTDYGTTEEIVFAAYATLKNEFQQSPLTEEIISRQQFDIRLLQENLKHEGKKQGFFSRLLKRKHRHRTRSASDGVLDSVRDFQRKHGHEHLKHEGKKKGFFSKLLRKNHKHRKRFDSDGVLESVRDFHRKYKDVGKRF